MTTGTKADTRKDKIDKDEFVRKLLEKIHRNIERTNRAT